MRELFWLHPQTTIWVGADQMLAWSPREDGFVELEWTDFEAMLRVARGDAPEPAAGGRLHALGMLSRYEMPGAAVEGWLRQAPYTPDAEETEDATEVDLELSRAEVVDWLRQAPVTLEVLAERSGGAAEVDLHRILSAPCPLHLWPCRGGFCVATREHEPGYVLLSPDDVWFLLRFRNPIAPAPLLNDLPEERWEAAEVLVRRLFAAQLLGALEADVPRGDINPPPWSPVPLKLGTCSRLRLRLRAAARRLQRRLRRTWDELSLAFVYAVAICPVGIALRALGKDPLHKEPDPQRQSYWTPIPLTGRRDRSRYRQPW